MLLAVKEPLGRKAKCPSLLFREFLVHLQQPWPQNTAALLLVFGGVGESVRLVSPIRSTNQDGRLGRSVTVGRHPTQFVVGQHALCYVSCCILHYHTT